jgi:hypothetical protein
VKLLCRIAKVDRVTYYRSLHQSEAALRKQRIVQTIRELQERSSYCLGVLSMQEELRNVGIVLSHNTVDKYMRENDLHSKVRVRRFPASYYVAMKEAMKNLPGNLLNRNLHV